MTSYFRMALGIACLALVVLASGARAQDYPSRSIRLMVPGAPGDSIDIISRAMAQKLTEAFGQTVVVDNRPGSGGSVIAAETTARAAPDGHTIMMANFAILAILPALVAKPTYDPVRDFAPVTRTAVVPNVIVVSPAFGPNTLPELIALAKAQPGKISYASPGIGTGQHLGTEQLKSLAGINLVHVPYKGAVPGIIDVASGVVQVMMVPGPAVATYLKAGKLKPLAITSARRSPALPDLPTVAEAGFPGYDVSAWYGIVAPAGTPVAVVAKLNREIIRILNLPDVRERLQGLGMEPVTDTPEQFAAYIKAQSERWAKVIRDAGIKAE
ncbi:MAG: Bug family tripartite tricarboxylate transporter substrate binding protein [Burkholderiales bacterium]